MNVYIQVQRVNDTLKVEHGKFSIDLIRTYPKLIIYLGDAVGLCINVCMTSLMYCSVHIFWQNKINA